MSMPDEHGNHGSVLVRKNEQGEFERVNTWPAELFTIDRIGLFGCIIHRSVYESISSPWFGHGLDECYPFCDAAREAGIDIWVDGRCPFGHIGFNLVDGLPEEKK